MYQILLVIAIIAVIYRVLHWCMCGPQIMQDAVKQETGYGDPAELVLGNNMQPLLAERRDDISSIRVPVEERSFGSETSELVY